MAIRAVLFDWRGTLVTTLDEYAWVRHGLAAAGRPADPAAVDLPVAAVRGANGDDRLDAPGVDSDADLHRRTHLGVLGDAGIDDDLAGALYAVESDLRHDPFADDVPETLASLHARGARVAVVSDVHVDVRPAFASAGLAPYVDVYTLSFEQGVQKPDPAVYARTLEALRVTAAEALMVGDRSGPDGAAVEQGIATLLLPPLRDGTERRLHRVLALVDAG